MRIENLINPAIPQQIQNEPPYNNEDLNSKDRLSDRNLALSDKTKWLLKKKDQPANNQAALVTISGRNPNNNTKAQTVLSAEYDFMNSMFRSEEQLFHKLLAAYGTLEQRNYKGNYINKFI